jgi:hypothetical protein
MVDASSSMAAPRPPGPSAKLADSGQDQPLNEKPDQIFLVGLRALETLQLSDQRSPRESAWSYSRSTQGCKILCASSR